MPTKNLVWMDLEMTGLDVNIERIIEMATIITDESLNVIAEGPVIAVKQSNELLGRMDKWNTKHHTQSGLVKRVQKSIYPEAEAQAKTLNFIKQYAEPGKAMLCGNSIWQDRKFLSKYMPDLEAYFHYRMIDVSAVKELAKMWAPDVYNSVEKSAKHEALEDIRDSIKELRHYKSQFLRLK